jgi:histidyl-tRNA synthetase
MALAELIGGVAKMTDITVAIDKLDKIGLEKVKDELREKGLKPDQISVIENYLSISGSNDERISRANQLFENSPAGKKGVEELETILNYPLATPHSPKESPAESFRTLRTQLTIDFTLARGLNYYTGIIFEVRAKDVQIGSIGGGGRYDDLTGLFGVPNVPGVGISFGVDRIYDVMEELKLFPSDVYVGTQVLFFNLGERESKVAFQTAQELRGKNIRCEIYHEPAKFDKQFKYAEKKNIPFVIIIGEEEIKNGTCKIKNIGSGKQVEISLQNIPAFQFS